MVYGKLIISCISFKAFFFHATNKGSGIFTETNFFCCFKQIINDFLNIP